MKTYAIGAYCKAATAAIVVGVLVLALASTAFAAPDLRVYEDRRGEMNSAFVPGEVVFRYSNDAMRFRVMQVPDVTVAIERLSRNPHIEFVEPNYIATASYVPNDPYYAPYQWNFDNDAYGGVHAEAAWDVARGAGTIVAVLDSGIAYENYMEGQGRNKTRYEQAPDLAGTCFVQGYDFINNDSHANDDHSHGTHVAGTIAQTTGNGEGVAGLAHETCLMPVKVLGRDGGGSYTDLINGIYFAVDNGANVINLSLGGPGNSFALQDAVQYAYENGVTVVAATGNNNGTISYPAAYDAYVIAVGATRYNETRAPYSNYGSALDLVAPGGDLSVDQNGDGYFDGILQQTINPNTKNINDFGYWFFQGTSMAAPHVAAAAAMLIGNGNATTPDEVREALQSTADDLGTSGRDDFYGHGLLNVAAALAWSAAPVDTPPNVTVSAPAEMVGVVTLSATANDDHGVTKVEFYVSGGKVGEDTSAPYETQFDSRVLADGNVTVTARAYDTIGQTAEDSTNSTINNVEDPNSAPTADAGPDQSIVDTDGNGMEVVMLDGSGSSDSDGTIVSYVWRENGTEIASGTSPSISLTVGSHTLTLEVTDDDGATDTDTVIIEVSEPAPLPDITLTLSGSKDRGRHVVSLTWSGAVGTDVAVIRNGASLTTTPNDGTYVDETGNRGAATYTYQVCESGTSTCSLEQSITF